MKALLMKLWTNEAYGIRLLRMLLVGGGAYCVSISTAPGAKPWVGALGSALAALGVFLKAGDVNESRKIQ